MKTITLKDIDVNSLPTQEFPKVHNFNDITDKKFGLLTVKIYAGTNQNRKATWHCQCDCGNVVAYLPTNALVSKNTLSCGCLRTKLLVSRYIKHGKAGTPTYAIWVSMLSRCNNKNSRAYKNYGERGISVCERWLKFENFYEDMGDCPSNYSLERIDNNQGYSPENCKWATRIEQANNQRKTILLTLGNRTQPLQYWAKELGINHRALSSRYKRGWTDEKTLTTPVRTR